MDKGVAASQDEQSTGDATSPGFELEAMIAAHQQRVTRLVQRLCGWGGEVEDVVQEVFLAAWRHRGRFRGESSVETWLTRIAINQCRKRQRRMLLWRRWFGRARREQAPVAPPADAAIARSEASRMVRSAVAALPLADREMIVLYYLEERSIGEIAAVLKIAANAANVRLHRARERLRGKLAVLDQEER